MSRFSAPLVSIVVPCLNQERFIEHALESLLAQTYPIEIIVIDGGSTDKTVDILHRYSTEENIRFISEEDEGQGDAISKGFTMSSGKFIGWLNADDFLSPTSVEIAAKVLVEEPEVGLVYGSVLDVSEDGKLLSLNAGQEFEYSALANIDFIPQVGSLFRRTVYDAVGGIRRDLFWTLDWDLWLRMSRITETRLLNQIVGYGRIHPHRKTAKGGFRRRAEIMRVSRKYGGVTTPTVLACAALNLCYLILWPLNALSLFRRNLAESLLWFPFQVLRLVLRWKPFMA